MGSAGDIVMCLCRRRTDTCGFSWTYCNVFAQEENRYLRIQLESKEADTVLMVEKFSQLDSQKLQTQQVGQSWAVSYAPVSVNCGRMV